MITARSFNWMFETFNSYRSSLSLISIYAAISFSRCARSLARTSVSTRVYSFASSVAFSANSIYNLAEAVSAWPLSVSIRNWFAWFSASRKSSRILAHSLYAESKSFFKWAIRVSFSASSPFKTSIYFNSCFACCNSVWTRFNSWFRADVTFICYSSRSMKPCFSSKRPFNTAFSENKLLFSVTRESNIISYLL